jgi:hypothetical protein
MRGWSFVSVPFLLTGAFLLQTESTLLFSDSAKVWVNRKYEFEKVLREGRIVSAEDLGEGRNKPKQVTLTLNDHTVKAIWKPIERGRHPWAWECYQAEVVAYRFDKMIGLNMVPPTIERPIGARTGSLQLWIDGGTLYEDVQDQTPNSVKWDRELSRMKLFDNLICNPDRHLGNFMVDSDWHIILIDHSQCFLSKTGLLEDPEMLPDLFDRKLVKALRALTLERLEVRFASFLMDRQIESIITRRDALLAHLDKLIAEKGEDAVLY